MCRFSVLKSSIALNARTNDAEAIRARSGVVYAGRNLLDVLPSSKTIWRRAPLLELLSNTLGNNGGLVRALFFDKPPERTWSLPWHKDLTIAVRDHHSPCLHFTKPTVKAGVPHVEAPLEVLQSMLTLRIHLDDMTDENGPLHVIPGSHRSKSDITNSASTQPIHLRRGDVFAVRPLLTHSSTSSLLGTPLHRRILRLELRSTRPTP